MAPSHMSRLGAALQRHQVPGLADVEQTGPPVQPGPQIEKAQPSTSLPSVRRFHRRRRAAPGEGIEQEEGGGLADVVHREAGGAAGAQEGNQRDQHQFAGEQQADQPPRDQLADGEADDGRTDVEPVGDGSSICPTREIWCQLRARWPSSQSENPAAINNSTARPSRCSASTSQTKTGTPSSRARTQQVGDGEHPVGVIAAGVIAGRIDLARHPWIAHERHPRRSTDQNCRGRSGCGTNARPAKAWRYSGSSTLGPMADQSNRSAWARPRARFRSAAARGSPAPRG